VTNAGLVQLHGLSLLKELHLKGTNVTTAGAEELRKTTPACRVIADAAGTTDLEKLQRQWVEASCECEGDDIVIGALRPPYDMTVEGNRTVVTDQAGAVVGSSFTLMPGQIPKEIDVYVNNGPNAGQKLQGIYELDDDHFKICLSVAGRPRPTEFTTRRGTGGICFQSWNRSR
jgi:uncharacterized protein (TIGR03067 family)